jgi:hypothetical protein
MKHVLIRFFLPTLLTLACFQALASAPDRQRIDDTLEAMRVSINAHDYATFEPLMDEDFTFQGRNSMMSTMIIRKVVEDFPHLLEAITVLSISPHDEGWIVAVRLQSPLSSDQRLVTISSDYLIKQADLVDIQVSGHGQETAEAPESSIEDFPAITTVPFELVNRLIMVKADVNGVYGNYMIDTGGQASMLNSTRFAEGTIDVFEMNHAPPSGAGGEILDAKGTNNLEISLGAIRVNGARAMVSDMSHMETNIGVELAGVIGFEVLEQFQLYFDYAAQQVTFQALGENNLPLQDLSIGQPEQVVDFEFAGHIPILPVRIGDLELKVGLDSGAAGQMIFTRFQDELRGEYEFITRDEMRGADHNVQMGDVVRISNMALGSIAYEDMIFRFNDLADHGGKAYPFDGLLGYGFLSNRPTAINFRTGKLYIWNNAES